MPWRGDSPLGVAGQGLASGAWQPADISQVLQETCHPGAGEAEEDELSYGAVWKHRLQGGAKLRAAPVG